MITLADSRLSGEFEQFRIRIRQKRPFALPGEWRAVAASDTQNLPLASCLELVLGYWLARNCVTMRDLRQALTPEGYNLLPPLRISEDYLEIFVEIERLSTKERHESEIRAVFTPHYSLVRGDAVAVWEENISNAF